MLYDVETSNLFSEEAEQSLIGAALIDEHAIKHIKRIGTGAFFRHNHKLIASAILSVFDSKEPVDLVTLSNQMKIKGQLDQVGGVAYLSDLQRNTPGASNARFYADKLLDYQIRRKKAKVLEQLISANLQGDPDTIAKAQHSFLALIDQDLSLRDGCYQFSRSYEGYDDESSYLIKGYVPRQALGMAYGASGSFKSFHALSWAVHVALGLEWNHCRVLQAPVLYIAGEGGLGVKRRIKALADKFNNGKPIDNLFRLDFPIAMGDVTQVNQLIESVRAQERELNTKFGLIIIDTLARCFGSGDENKTEDMGRFIAACDRLKVETGATILVIHHSGAADKERARGSTSLRAACDFEFRIERATEGSRALVLVQTKAKDDVEQPKQMFELTEHYLFTDGDGETVKSLACNNGGITPSELPATVNQLTPNEQALWAAVARSQKSGDHTHIKAIRDKLRQQGMAISHFSKWLNGCLKKGALQKNDQTLTVTESQMI